MSANMHEVAKDILEIKPDDSMVLSSLFNRFYNIMRKHGIKWGHEEGYGMVGPDPEWIMAYSLFVSQITLHLEAHETYEIPEDLLS